MKILFAGDIVGKPGRKAFAAVAERMREKEEVDFIVANAENAAGGRGPSPKIVKQLYRAGADVLTLGDHSWDEKELIPQLDEDKRLVRPANFARTCPGRGWTTISTERGNLTVINLIGRVFMRPHYNCPFEEASRIFSEATAMSKITIVDFHAEATSEKIAMGRHLDGRASAVVGSHTHVQTADEEILPGGTAYITDLGMTGPKESVLGRDIKPVLQKFKTGMPQRLKVASGPIKLEGVVLEIDDNTGRAVSIERIRQSWEPNEQ